jgi:hypothetical protein
MSDSSIVLIYPSGGESLKGVVQVCWQTNSFDDYSKIYLYYSCKDSDSWVRINEEGLVNDGSYNWSTILLDDGWYQLIIELVSLDNNIIYDTNNYFIIDNDMSNLDIEEIIITNMITSNNKAVKNGDSVRIEATILNGEYYCKDDISANLTGLGGNKDVVADSYDGRIATWDISYVLCEPKDGLIDIMINVAGIEQKSASIIADNVRPSVTIQKPLSGIYLFDRRIVPFTSSIIIGSFTVELLCNDNTHIIDTKIYIDSTLMYSYPGIVTSYMLNERLFGKHVIRVVVRDAAENTNETCSLFSIHNLFL